MSGGSIGGTLGTALGVALAPETGGMSLAIPGFAGAAGSALGGAMTGSKNIWKDALLGGIGGLAGGGINNLTGNASGLGNLFKTGDGINSAIPSWFGGNAGSAAQSTGTGLFDKGISQAVNAAGDSVAMNSPEAVSFGVPNAASALAIPSSSSAASPGIMGSLTKFAPYGALGLGAIGLDSMNRPKTLGPPMAQHPSNPGKVAPLNRQQQAVDPNSYYAPSTQGARDYFQPYPMQTQFMARGGLVRGFKNGGSSSASSSNIPQSSVGGKLANSKNKTPALYPVKGKNTGVFRYYADGGMVDGAGDGQSDSIPANLSDGEFVVSAPVVSALGNGSNDAGAKKLNHMQKKVLHKHYKGGKPKKAMGLGNYVH